ncbi:hypothetical protein PLEIONE_6 [Mycobacterium phage Pleione]|uniref:Uncharacterized protein n=7 Tax=Bixzunavirus Bxz1 TaxID=2006134 RepID=R4TDD2_9CAUD|nr:hypothetical protein M181_gp007 [Mycobacterium phage Gizmo]YP_009017780.1 hypothetical protein PLEIONE_6 [Mycobacterium phage Pleione]AFL46701.1 hypothetical protein AVA3_6 [Mycobacterium phage Ava3]AGV99726.1 hypothetical protein PBI_SHRIMP_6 [Mycobacterium phage Shrimp]AIX12687.1 hypothetical protein PBI_ZYGOTAIGA_6 [Mycobacterium phage ZygoTaiga]AKY02301.1 hypothetical protein SEA_ZEENON_7 [Mycobacterium phage Zeenon]AOZ63187.1 hypothetical protein SEA_ERDMANN_6 [Mycobacterium phage Erd
MQYSQKPNSRSSEVTFQLNDYEARYLHAQMGKALNAKEQP